MADTEDNIEEGLMPMAQITAPPKVNRLRKLLMQQGYKSIWQTEAINHARDGILISSWVRDEIPVPCKTPKAYQASIFQDALLIERYQLDIDMTFGECLESYTYIHGVEPKLRPFDNPPVDEDEYDEWNQAADAAEVQE